MTDATQVQQRRAVEALRSGVPNRDAVRALGSSQIGFQESFSELLEALRGVSDSAKPAGGLLLGGGFGAGKSHLLEFLQHNALTHGFIVSKVVVSKETPFHDPGKVYRSAVESAVLPDRNGPALDEIASKLRFDSASYVDLFKWVHASSSGLDERFAATLWLYERCKTDDLEFLNRIVRFWAGDPIKVSDVRSRLKDFGQASAYRLRASPERVLAPQRFRFAARLMKAAGYGGWVLLIDEVELVGRYSVLQRAKSYGEITRWVRGFGEDPVIPVGAVLAMTDDFAAAVLLPPKNDFELIPNKLRSRARAEDDFLAGQAELGMRIVDREMVRLEPPDAEELDRVYAQLKQIHGQAYGWEPPDVPGLERLGATRIRQHVRAWINEWDLRRLDPEYLPETETVEFAPRYSEDPDLEVAPEDEEPAEE